MNNIKAFQDSLLVVQRAAAGWLYAGVKGKTDEQQVKATELKSAMANILKHWPDAPTEVPLFSDFTRHVKFGEAVDMMNILQDELPAAFEWCWNQVPSIQPAVDAMMGAGQSYVDDDDNSQFNDADLDQMLQSLETFKEAVLRQLNEIQGGQAGIQEKMKEVNRRVQDLHRQAHTMGKVQFGLQLMGTVAKLVKESIVPDPTGWGSLLGFAKGS